MLRPEVMGYYVLSIGDDTYVDYGHFPISDGESTLEEDYSLAKKEKSILLGQIDELIGYTKSPYRMDHIAAIKRGCKRYGMFNKLVENNKHTPRHRGSLYDLEYSSVLKAMLLAYDLIDISELHYREKDEVFEEDGKWIEELSEIIKNHWNAQLSAHDKLNAEVFGSRQGF